MIIDLLYHKKIHEHNFSIESTIKFNILLQEKKIEMT